MMRRKLLGRGWHTSLSALLAAALSASTAAARPDAGASPSGTRITHVSVERPDTDSTVVAVAFDGAIAGHRWSHIDGDNPRAIVKIAGIVEAYRPYEVAVGDGRVHRIRIGHHPEFDPPEEHLVFDLADSGVAIARVIKQDRRLTVVLRRLAPAAKPRPPAPVAPVSTPIPVTPTPTPTPAMTPSPTLTPTATATGTPTSPPPSAAPEGPTPPEPPPVTTATTPTKPEQVATPDLRAATTPLPGLAGPLLTELVISHREDGSALVRVTADRQVERTDIRFFNVRGAPPRNLLVMPGTGLPWGDARLSVRDGLLCEIGVAFTTIDGPARTELTFYLASPEVTFEQAAVKGTHAVIHLRPPSDPQAPLGCEVESRVRSRVWRFSATGPPQEQPFVTE
jgi:hypothetical protein